jgi:hypothetical protein
MVSRLALRPRDQSGTGRLGDARDLRRSAFAAGSRDTGRLSLIAPPGRFC